MCTLTVRCRNRWLTMMIAVVFFVVADDEQPYSLVQDDEQFLCTNWDYVCIILHYHSKILFCFLVVFFFLLPLAKIEPCFSLQKWRKTVEGHFLHIYIYIDDLQIWLHNLKERVTSAVYAAWGELIQLVFQDLAAEIGFWESRTQQMLSLLSLVLSHSLWHTTALEGKVNSGGRLQVRRGSLHVILIRHQDGKSYLLLLSLDRVFWKGYVSSLTPL